MIKGFEPISIYIKLDALPVMLYHLLINLLRWKVVEYTFLKLASWEYPFKLQDTMEYNNYWIKRVINVTVY